MNKTILFPTDFTHQSLQPLRAFLPFQTDGAVDIVLIHAIHLTDSISELLFYDKDEMVAEIAGLPFLEQLQAVKAEFPEQLSSIRIELFSGFTQNAFNSLCEALNVEKIVLSDGYDYRFTGKRSLNILPYLKKSKLSKATISWSRQDFGFDTDAIQIIPAGI